MRVLVAAASRHGATGEIADRIGADLAERGIDVEVRSLRDVKDVRGYEAVVLGSAIYFGRWMNEAMRFVRAHSGELSERPTWLFGSGSIVCNPPIADDPNAIRPSLVEELISSTQAREHKLFAGKLDASNLGLAERLAVRMTRSHDGDWREWEAVDSWAAAIAEALKEPGENELVADLSRSRL